MPPWAFFGIAYLEYSWQATDATNGFKAGGKTDPRELDIRQIIVAFY